MPDSTLDNDLLAGLLALKAGLIKEGELVSVFRRWVNDRSAPLQDLLLREGVLSEDAHSRLDHLVFQQLADHGDDPFHGLVADSSLANSLAICLDDPKLIERVKSIATISSVRHRDVSSDLEEVRISGYKLLSQLGEGGMGSVFVAEQESPVRRRVALKVIRKGMDSAQILARFEAERQALAMMNHPNIARVFDTGATQDGRPYFAMELVKGIPITEYCNQQRLSLSVRLDLFVEVCRAVQHAHQKGIIHRDIKPSNVLVALHEGQAVSKVIDFGLAKALQQNLTDRTVYTQLGQVVGTLEYMSPEQAQMNALDIDTRSDIYSLGVLLYELLTGSTPLQRETIKATPLDELLNLIRESDPPRPSVRLSQLGESLSSISEQRSTHPHKLSQTIKGDLDWIVMKALEKDRTRRYETANGLASDIRRYLNDEPVMATPPSPGYRFRKFARRNKRLLAGCIAMTTILVAATLISSISAAWALKERSAANISAGKFQAINDFIIDDLLSAARPEGQGLGVDVTLKEALDQAATKIPAAFDDQPEIEAEVRSTLGRSYLLLGAYDDAEHHLVEALRLRRLLLGEQHKDTLRSLLQYGQLLFSQSKYEQAESCYRDICDGFGRVYGVEHTRTLDARRALARAMSEQGRYRDALPILRTTLSTCLAALGEDDEATLNTRNELAYTLRDLGEFQEAEQMFRRNLQDRRRRDGDRHPETLISMNNLAGLLDEMNVLDEAEALFLECLELRKEVFGDDHPKIATVMNNLGVLYNRKGEFEKAEPLIRSVIEINGSLRGAEHVYTLRSTLTLTKILDGMKRYDEAETLARNNLAAQERVLGSRHRDVLVGKQVLGDVLRGQEKYDEAETLHREILAIRREDKVRWQDMADSLLALGRTLDAKGQSADAEPYLRECIAFYQADLPRNLPKFVDTTVAAGTCLTALRNFGDAEQLLLEGQEVIDDHEGQPGVNGQAIIQQLIILYDAWEKPDQAQSWRDRQ